MQCRSKENSVSPEQNEYVKNFQKLQEIQTHICLEVKQHNASSNTISYNPTELDYIYFVENTELDVSLSMLVSAYESWISTNIGT